jgi:peptide chain release factor 1
MVDLLEKLKSYEDAYNKFLEQLGSSDVSQDPDKIKEYGQKLSDIEEIVQIAKKYRKARESFDDTKEMLKSEKDEAMKEYFSEEFEKNKAEVEKFEKKILIYLTPKDPNDAKNVIIEIRAGAGGDEAGLFAAVLFRMYTKYAENRKWKHSVLSSSSQGVGGFKEIIFDVEGKSVYSDMKYESGVHRVQRVPVTDSGGRIHTSTATVAVLPEAEEVDVKIELKDLRIDVYRSTGPGGQSVNTTDSAVRITHVPTGLVVSCQDEKSQLQNKEKALKILRARIKEIEEQKQSDEQTKNRRLQIGTGDRSERIRTYNYPQVRITDHRINLTLYKFDDILEGGLEELIDSLRTADEEKKLEKLEI